MAQNLEFSATSGLTLTATAYAIGTYSSGTNAGSVTQQAGTNRYLAAFASNLTAGAWRLDFLVSGTCIGQEVYDVDGSGTYQPRSELATLNTIEAQTALIGTNTSLGVTQDEENSSNTIRLKIGSTKVKVVPITDGNGDDVVLTGKTLELHVRTKNDTFVATLIVTPGIGEFSFTPTTAINVYPAEYYYALREPSDGNNSLVDGILTVAYAADGE